MVQVSNQPSKFWMLNLLRVGAVELVADVGDVDAEDAAAAAEDAAAAVGGDGDMAGEIALRISVGDVGCG
jgi:hypothetical protein